MLLQCLSSSLTWFFSSDLVTVASTPENILNKTDSIALRDLSTESTSSSTNVQTEAQSKNGQIASELNQKPVDVETPDHTPLDFINFNQFLSGDSGLTIVRRLSGKKAQQQLAQSEPSAENQLEQYFCPDSQPSVSSEVCSLLENQLKMQPTSVNDELDSIDLTTENLPAVDTPDACDKAALRYEMVFPCFHSPTLTESSSIIKY